MTWDRSQSVMGRHHRRRCDIFCVTVTHCDVESGIQLHRVFNIGILESSPEKVLNLDVFDNHSDDNCQKFEAKYSSSR